MFWLECCFSCDLFVETQSCGLSMAARGSAVRRCERRTRSWWRHEQASVRMASVSASHHSFQRAHRVDQGVQIGVPWVHDFVMSEPSDDSAAIENVIPGPDVTKTAPALVIEYVLDDTFAARAPVIKHLTFAPDDTNIAPASPRVDRDVRGLENPQFSAFAVEASASQVGGSFSCRGRVNSARVQFKP